ncbi:MAG: IS200/IS605 family transposase [Planctomycetes bacterium]|nr:IS200/IS605 family transposase [Planctomycetota bacterium]
MAHTYTRILVHMVFATHERRPLIHGDLKPELHAYMAGTIRNLGTHLYALNGVEDHCHLIIDLPPKLALADFANKLKAGATKWAKQNGEGDFGWQRGYGAFSMNQESLDRAIRYVEGQEEHHRKQSFREELEEFIRLHGMDPDPEFIDGVWRKG